MKKPFKETRLGKFLGGKGLDAALGVAGMIYPPLSAVDSIKDIIMGDKSPVPLSDADKKEFLESYQLYLSELDMQLKDVANARDMYGKKSEMTDRIAKWIMLWNLPMILICVLGLIGCTYYLNDMTLALISATIGGVIQNLISERQTATNFFLGSSAGSKASAEAIRQKLKDDTGDK